MEVTLTSRVLKCSVSKSQQNINMRSLCNPARPYKNTFLTTSFPPLLALTRCLHSRGLFTDCGMNCHRLCKDQVAFECKKNAKGSSTSEGPLTPGSTPGTTGGPEGEEGHTHTHGKYAWAVIALSEGVSGGVGICKHHISNLHCINVWNSTNKQNIFFITHTKFFTKIVITTCSVAVTNQSCDC